MRAIWTGTISFGLVNVPVKAYSATEDHDVPLHQVHAKDGGRIRYQRKCEICGQVVPYEEIDKAYDDGENTVILTDKDLKSLPAEASREIEVVEFVPTEQVEPMMFERSYYLEPDSKSAKAYILLRTTLQNTDRTAIVKFAMRQKTRLGALRVRDAALVLQSLLWADEVREPDFPSIHQEAKISSAELKMAKSLVDEFSSDFTPEDYEDDYQRELRILIDEKIKKGDTVSTEETFGETEQQGEGEEEGGEVIDLMAALKRSVEKRRGENGASKKNTEKSASASGDDSSETGKKSASAKKSPSGGRKKEASKKEKTA
ncbi:Ku protein [Propionimicrobium sp. PCR01-08-3]|uniref:non-homologous end joining protein Ku n=1 Tax=Propionimicrobium sp. PCR01-08-3 TaxID=3052086 RepID=UPI00255C7357|nr:Ku protein [Propionimicrobium sp. PCR01-08-3]WIY82927.1 Ku protein [Propionimicrobium sp. PCR01-08-3]